MTVSATIDHAQVSPPVSCSQMRTSVRTFSIGERTPADDHVFARLERSSGNTVWSRA